MTATDQLLARLDRSAEVLRRLGNAMDHSDFDRGDTERDIARLLGEAAAALRTTETQRDAISVEIVQALLESENEVDRLRAQRDAAYAAIRQAIQRHPLRTLGVEHAAEAMWPAATRTPAEAEAIAHATRSKP